MRWYARQSLSIWTCPKGSKSFLKLGLPTQHSPGITCRNLSQRGRRKMSDAVAYVGSVQDSLCIGTLLDQGQKCVRNCSQWLLQSRNYFLPVISTLTHDSDIVSDVPSGSILDIYIYIYIIIYMYINIYILYYIYYIYIYIVYIYINNIYNDIYIYYIIYILYILYIYYIIYIYILFHIYIYIYIIIYILLYYIYIVYYII